MPFSTDTPYAFTEAGISGMASGQQGVYGITNSDNEYIYVGQAQDLRASLLEHFRKTSDQSGCIWGYFPSLVYAELADSDMDAVELERIKFHHPACNNS